MPVNIGIVQGRVKFIVGIGKGIIQHRIQPAAQVASVHCTLLHAAGLNHSFIADDVKEQDFHPACQLALWPFSHDIVAILFHCMMVSR